MQSYFHNHVAYDELIVDSQSDKQSHYEPFKINKIKGKPFSLDRSEQFQSQQKQKQKSYYQKIKLKSEQSDQLIPEQQYLINDKPQKAVQDSSLVYELDFQSYEESRKPSRVDFSSRYHLSQKNNQFYRDGTVNYSAQLPNIHHIESKNKKYYINIGQSPSKIKQRRISHFSKRQKSIEKDNYENTKQVLLLRKQNVNLARQIQQLKQIYPLLVNNSLVLAAQREQIRKLKHKQFIIFDAEYEFKLDKDLEKFGQKKQKLKLYILQRNQKLRKKDAFLNRRIKKKDPIDPIELFKHQNSDIVREHYLSKKRQQAINESKIEESSQKIVHYKQKIQELESKIHLDSFQDLERRKIFLQYNINMKRQEYSEHQELINQDLQVMKTQITEIQNKVNKIQQQNENLKQQNEQNGGQIKKDIMSQQKSNVNEVKKAGIILKFFNKRKK